MRPVSSLSPLVVHGKLLWESVVALACVAGIVAAWLLPRRARRRRAAAIRASLGEGTSSLAPPSAEKLVVVSGKVVKASGSPEKKLAAATLVPAAMAFAEEGSKRAHTATAAGEPLVLEVGGAHVALHGNVQILVGSRESGRGLARRRAHRALEDLASQLEAKTRDGLALRTLHAGDLVRAQGILRHTPSETGAESYRVAASAYTLSPSEEGNHPGFVPVVFEGAPSPLEQSRPEVVGRVLAFPAVAFVALAAVGELAMHSAPSSPGAATIAAATPLRRFEALAALRAQTSLSASPSDATLRDEASLDTLRGFYGMASDDYARANRPEEAATIAAHYGDPFRVARARFVNGEIAEAASSARRRAPTHCSPTGTARRARKTSFSASSTRSTTAPEAATTRARSNATRTRERRGSPARFSCSISAMGPGAHPATTRCRSSARTPTFGGTSSRSPMARSAVAPSPRATSSAAGA
jgi:hypothetical protein